MQGTKARAQQMVSGTEILLQNQVAKMYTQSQLPLTLQRPAPVACMYTSIRKFKRAMVSQLSHNDT